ncbi:chaperone modulator CbpM [Hyphomicrobium sp.]|uniref:chaperone modulator CbpM n=1 Tax=Hyphomicrobium sp. TaxID=82 RepID=UPI002D771499|nr:chaperone modulator CbpM [Hyphomicrobium sp.]HET6389603.1 chaperone modulator CbpM [Hyphomicrobium sp.]
MTNEEREPMPAEMIGSAAVYSLQELSQSCEVETSFVSALVAEGIIEPQGSGPSEWKFSSLSVVRTAKAKRFDRDLGLNPAGIALVLDLLNEIEHLQARLSVLANAKSSLAERSVNRS